MSLKIVQRGAIWYIRGTVCGRSVYESTGLGDKRAAETRRALREAELVQYHLHGRAATLTFAQAALTYQEAGGEGRYLAPIIRHFGARKLVVDIDNAAVNACALALYPNAAPATINRQVITPISAVIHHAAEDDPRLERRFRRRREPQGRLRWLTPEEAERMLFVADKRTRCILLFLLGTGCRVSEALGLDASDLHLFSGEAWIGRTKTREPRMVTLPRRVRTTLISAGLPTEGRVFRTPKGGGYVLGTGHGGQIETAFETARDRAKLGPDVTPHVLRHTWATWHYAANRDIVRLMASGGWATPKIALRYTKLGPRDLPARLESCGWGFTEADGAETKTGQAG